MAARYKEDSSRPNYFVAVQITNPAISNKVDEIQRHVLQQDNRFAAAAESLATLHISLTVMYLPRSNLPMDRIQAAMQKIVEQAKQRLDLPLTLRIEGVGNFSNSVVFAEIARDPAGAQLQDLADIVKRSFEEFGIPSMGRDNFHPHVTIFKLIKARSLQQQGIRSIPPALYAPYKNETMGAQPVTTIQLCSMQDYKDAKGYYKVVHQVQL